MLTRASRPLVAAAAGALVLAAAATGFLLLHGHGGGSPRSPVAAVDAPAPVSTGGTDVEHGPAPASGAQQPVAAPGTSHAAGTAHAHHTAHLHTGAARGAGVQVASATIPTTGTAGVDTHGRPPAPAPAAPQPVGPPPAGSPAPAPPPEAPAPPTGTPAPPSLLDQVTGLLGSLLAI